MAERPAAGVDHSRHDIELVARVAAGDGSDADVRSAAVLRGACSECLALDVDLRLLAAGTRDLRSAPMPAAPRDFRLSSADAARLRRHGPGALFGRRGSGTNRAVGRFGGGLVAIGLVGLVVGSGFVGGFPGLGAGGAAVPAAAPASTSLGQKDNATEGLVLAPAQTAAASAPATSQGTAAYSAAQGAAADARDTSASGGPGSPVLYISVAALVVGLALVVAGRNGRRAGP